MGYHADKRLIYGVKISSNDAQTLDAYFRQLYDFPLDENLEEVFQNHKLGDFDFCGEGADISIHHTFGFEDTDNYNIYHYFFGIQLESDKSIKIIQKGPTDKMKEKWKLGLSHLKAAGIKTKKADFHIYTQTL